MQLYQILEDIDAEYLQELSAMEISGICIDSHKVKTGELFVCLKGGVSDGNNFIAEALSKGARAFITEEASQLANAIVVKDARKAFSRVCKNFYHKACDKLNLIAVTGTNGKTTSVNLIAEILRGAGKNVAKVGTMGIEYNGKCYETGFTTPDPDILHKHFFEMVNAGVEYVIMEASAHAIALKKLDGLKFEIGVLTNITQDHLDFFGDMSHYAQTKLAFFNSDNMKIGVVCADDGYAQKLISSSQNLTILSYGIENPSDIFAVNIEEGFEGTCFVCNCFDEIAKMKTNLVGRYNVTNALASIIVCRVLGLSLKEVANYIKYVNPVEGRFNVINHPKCNVVIDYAHTPDGLENVLKTARPLTKGRLFVAFGCGGNRDRLKRPIMGKIASQLADKVFLTSDNPRNENPFSIIREIESGIDKNKPYAIYENRTEAISKALDECRKGDTLVIAGKGGEKYQEINGKKIPYNDFDAVYKYFREHIVNLKRRDEDESN